MKVKELIAQLQNLVPGTVVVVAGFETQSTGKVAGADVIKQCLTVSCSEDSMHWQKTGQLLYGLGGAMTTGRSILRGGLMTQTNWHNCSLPVRVRSEFFVYEKIMTEPVL